MSCKLDLRPGGLFHFVMQSPEGQNFPNDGCYLKIVPNRKLVWTNAIAPGFRPCQPSGSGCDTFLFTGVILFEPHGSGTKYTAIALHADEAGRKTHEQMGFQEGWGKPSSSWRRWSRGSNSSRAWCHACGYA